MLQSSSQSSVTHQDQLSIPSAASSDLTPSPSEAVRPDVEHIPVTDDPREWSPFAKNLTLAMVSSATMISGLGGSIQNPAVQQMQMDLSATSSQFSWSISAFIVAQGIMPLVWSSMSELKGRKPVYIISLTLFTLASAAVALSRNIDLIIGFRCLQGAGSSAVMNIGAATMADIFEPSERGTKMGIFYIAYLLGPSIGPILGGVLTSGLGWRFIFWFLTIFCGTICVSFIIFFQDTFRRERSLTYQTLLKKRLEEAAQGHVKQEIDECTKPTTDPEKGFSQEVVVAVSFRDVNPAMLLAMVLRRPNNIAILLSSGFFFAFGYFIPYTTSRTLSSHYNYDALTIGFVLVCFGLGSVAGSLFGGRFSDFLLARLKTENGDVSYPEMRLKSAFYSAFSLPLSILGFGWVCQKHVHVAVLCLILVSCGFLSMWTYASTFAYIVDSNPGQSSAVVATNSVFRGVFAFVAVEVAVPLQDSIGDGWTYTIWAGLMLISGLLIVLVAHHGESWRQKAKCFAS